MKKIYQKQRFFKIRKDPSQKNSFAHGLNFYKLFWVYFIGCFLGVVLETIWCVIVLHRIENRTGLIFGPFNPVYGFGAVLITLCLYHLRHQRDLFIFADGVVLGGAFEYAASWIQEILFKTVSWEYSHTEFNIGGRTNLLYAFIWGILALLWIKNLYPLFSGWIEKIPEKIGKSLTWVLVVFMTLNMIISSLAILRQTERREHIAPHNVIERTIDYYFNDAFLKWVYPNMIKLPIQP